ncbi:helix-turn-helix domain-containing protein [Cohnella endophytica]|uniref:Helix-turn-helix domain-containing protein n=1 Tax=Cohnella endophytica TaxID=2419778 RepID=A0A494XAW4_9BACL|nr:helix-turn-helix transcriptional regulator [Cohnella endophytica]RKP47967.1 helix-turn-helix domain-containing protein [Cohnella endophytica]
MIDDTSYTPEEVAALLKISKLKVYDLLKKGEIPAYRVGKQMRIESSDLDAYKQRSKGISAVSPNVTNTVASAQPLYGSANSQRERSIIITGQDVSLDILARHLERQLPGMRPLRSYVGSMDSLVSMYRGESDIVSTHLLDGDTGQYNTPYIRKLFVGQSYVVVNMLRRSAGLYVKKGNPLKLESWADLSQSGIRLANREKGSGARVLLDEQLRLHGIPSTQLSGYEGEENSHLAVAGKVAAGEADVGVGIEKAALLVGNVDFVPLIQEQYDLVMLKRDDNRIWIEGVIAILRSDSFRSELVNMEGYDISRTGDIVYEA